jgi:hypothetical protein
MTVSQEMRWSSRAHISASIWTACLQEAPPDWTKDGEEEEVEEQQLPWLLVWEGRAAGRTGW